MKCPYMWNTIENIHHNEPKIKVYDIENADGTPDRIHLSGFDSAYTRTRYLHDCLTNDCACFEDGKCQRR